MSPAQPMNLVVFLARSGIGSRRSCDELIREGVVTVNGEVVTFPREKVTPEDVVTVRGEPVEARELRYFLVNKPRGVASTRSDPHADRVIVDIVPNGRTLFPVGRLDVDTTGLIILTNDGVLANRLHAPAVRRPQDLRRPRARQGEPARPRHAAAGRGPRGRPDLTRGRQAQEAERQDRRSSRSPSTRAASARCGACSSPSACRWKS